MGTAGKLSESVARDEAQGKEKKRGRVSKPGGTMTLDDFNKATELMFQAFTPFKPTDKLRAFYEFFRSEREDDIRLTCRVLSYEHERFPSVQLFASVLRSLKERRAKNDPTTKIDCKWCDGIGIVTAIAEDKSSWAYRCCCTNGARFKNYPAWFGETHRDKVLYGVKRKEEVSECPF